MTRSNTSSNESEKSVFSDCAPLESSTSLEASAPLDYREEVRLVTQASVNEKMPPSPDVATVDVAQQHNRLKQETVGERTVDPATDRQEPVTRQYDRSRSMQETVEEKTIPLLEERLIVDRKKRKTGEIVVRKVIETHIVEVPVRRETLIVEQIGSEPRQLASIDLGQDLDGAVELVHSGSMPPSPISGEFTSIKAASQFLATIAASQPELSRQNVQIKIAVDSVEEREVYQQWLDRYLNNPPQNL